MEPDKAPHLVRAAVASGLIATLAGCSGASHSAVVTPTLLATSTPPPVAEKGPLPPSTSYTLGLLDAATATAYTARYHLVSGGQPLVTVDVATTAGTYSLKLSGAGSASEFLVNAKGSFSCELGTTRRCYLVAKPGQPVPASLDPTLERVFRNYLHELATHPEDYHLGRVGPGTAASIGVPAGECFTAQRKGAATPATVSKGTYCWSKDGVLTKYVSPSGTLTLVSLQRGK